MFSKKATKIDEIFTVDWIVKLTVKILSIFVAFLENMNFTITYFYSNFSCLLIILQLSVIHKKDKVVIK